MQETVRLTTIRTKHLDTFVHTLLSTAHVCFSDCEIVHYQTLGPSLFSFVPRLFGKKTVVTVQGLDWQRKKWSWPARLLLKLGEWAAARLPDETIVVSRVLEEHFHLRHNKKTVYIPNGTDLRERLSGTYLEQFGLAQGGYVLFAGRLSPEKNCDLLIDAFETLDTEMKLVFAGGSSHPDAYAAGLRNRQSDRIVFLDWLAGNALTEVLTNAAIFVMPSDIEGMSLAVLEAMGAGVCVLASDIPENREVIGDAGICFPSCRPAGPATDARAPAIGRETPGVIRSEREAASARKLSLGRCHRAHGEGLSGPERRSRCRGRFGTPSCRGNQDRVTSRTYAGSNRAVKCRRNGA